MIKTKFQPNKKNKKIFKNILDKFLLSLVFSFFAISVFGVYLVGYAQGYATGRGGVNEQISALFDQWFENLSDQENVVTPTVTSTPGQILPTNRPRRTVSWGGPELWEAVNNRRQELGVNPLDLREDLCTIAAIRLNQLLELGKLDNHDGFNQMQKDGDLDHVFEEYTNLAEFLAFGGETAEETVSLWENTLGHRKLLTGGEYVWGCIYAQNTFAVAITAF